MTAFYERPSASTSTWTWSGSPTATITNYYERRQWLVYEISGPSWRFIPPLPTIPKNWRWWHALARWIVPQPVIESRSQEPPTRALCGFSLAERRRRKRRYYVQRLAA